MTPEFREGLLGLDAKELPALARRVDGLCSDGAGRTHGLDQATHVRAAPSLHLHTPAGLT